MVSVCVSEKEMDNMAWLIWTAVPFSCKLALDKLTTTTDVENIYSVAILRV